jgi:glucose-6-phosphate isomerase
MRFDLKPSKVDERKIKNSCDKLKPLINEIRQTVNQGGYKTKYAPLNLVDDKQLVREVKKKSRAKSLILVGIGGSNLGTKAVQEAVKNCKVFYADTVDPAKMKDILDNLPNKSILNIVSESGTTTETIANAEILLKHHKGEVAVTTRKESPLWKIAEKKGWQKLEVPNTIGGRYSVLSAVGLFPLSVLGIDIDALIRGAKKTRDESLKYNSAAAKTAAILYSHMKKRPIHDTFLFSTMLENLGKWYRNDANNKHRINRLT